MIELKLPEGCRVLGGLYPPTDARMLDSDMLKVACCGHTINVDWDPEHDLNGKYLVTLYRGRWENQLHFFATRNVDQVKRYIESTVEELTNASRPAPLPASGQHPA